MAAGAGRCLMALPACGGPVAATGQVPAGCIHEGGCLLAAVR
jgi:hypothetical protein